MDGTILGQGSFVVASGVPVQVIAIPSNADWVEVYNYTQYGTTSAAATGTGVKFYWQRGMAPGTGIVDYKIDTTAGTILQGDTLVSGGFTLYDPSGQSGSSAAPLIAPAVNFTAITNAQQPVVSTTSTAGIAVGSVVRVYSKLANGTNGTATIGNIAGIDFVVGAVTANTSFTLLTAASEFPAGYPAIITGTGSWRLINYPPLFYPRKLIITNITNAVNPTVSTATAHGLTPGQEVRFNIPAVSGMVQLNGTTANNYLPATVVSVTDRYDFVIDIDTTGFSAFTWPLGTQQPSSFPECTPFGENTATALLSLAAQTPLDWNGLQVFNSNTGILADSTINSGYLGMILGNGGFGASATMAAVAITGPAGSVAADVVYWKCGKASFGGL